MSPDSQTITNSARNCLLSAPNYPEPAPEGANRFFLPVLQPRLNQTHPFRRLQEFPSPLTSSPLLNANHFFHPSLDSLPGSAQNKRSTMSLFVPIKPPPELVGASPSWSPANFLIHLKTLPSLKCSHHSPTVSLTLLTSSSLCATNAAPAPPHVHPTKQKKAYVTPPLSRCLPALRPTLF